MATLKQKVRRQYVLIVGTRLPPCEEITKLISASMDRRLTLREWLQKRLHLVFCAMCTRYGQQLAAMRRLARQYEQQAEVGAGAEPRALSAEARARIKRAISERPPV
ncbi:MAG: hypothetical protein U0Q12_08325 [Vicinamibacterales bacterium]